MGVTARGRWLFGVSSREVSSPHPRMGGWEIPPPREGGRHQSCVGHRSSPPMRGEEAPPPRGGRHPPLAVWAPVILLVRVVWHSYQVVRRVGGGRGPWGCGARATALGVVVGCAQHVQAECYRGSGAVTAYGRVARGGSSARVRMYVGTSHIAYSVL